MSSLSAILTASDTCTLSSPLPTLSLSTPHQCLTSYFFKTLINVSARHCDGSQTILYIPDIGKIIFDGVKDTVEQVVLGNEEDSVTKFTSRVFLRLITFI